MPRGGAKTPKPPVGNVDDPESLYNHMRRFLAYMESKHYSPETLATRERHLRWFLIWCDDRGITNPREVDRAVLEGYQRYLFHYRKADGAPLAVPTQHLRIIPIGLWFRWMTKRGVLPINPASELELPRLGNRLPKAVLTAREAETVLALPDITTTLGLRDRAVLETFYSTGIRRAELIHLRIHDIDHERGVVRIFQGKNSKDRVVPIGDRALAWVAAYLEQARPRLVRHGDNGTLFLTNRGGAFSVVRLTSLVEGYVNRADLGKRGSCHLFRHTAVTLMLENGADIRLLQTYLGHADLGCTARYTHVSIQKLKEVHTATHPGKMPEVGQHPPDGVLDPPGNPA